MKKGPRTYDDFWNKINERSRDKAISAERIEGKLEGIVKQSNLFCGGFHVGEYPSYTLFLQLKGNSETYCLEDCAIRINSGEKIRLEGNSRDHMDKFGYERDYLLEVLDKNNKLLFSFEHYPTGSGRGGGYESGGYYGT